MEIASSNKQIQSSNSNKIHKHYLNFFRSVIIVSQAELSKTRKNDHDYFDFHWTSYKWNYKFCRHCWERKTINQYLECEPSITDDGNHYKNPQKTKNLPYPQLLLPLNWILSPEKLNPKRFPEVHPPENFSSWQCLMPNCLESLPAQLYHLHFR